MDKQMERISNLILGALENDDSIFPTKFFKIESATFTWFLNEVVVEHLTEWTIISKGFLPRDIVSHKPNEPQLFNGT